MTLSKNKVFYGSMHGGKESNHISCSFVNQIILHILSVQIIFYVLALKVLCSCGTLWSVYLFVWFVLVQVDWTYESELLFQEICFALRLVMFCTENVCVPAQPMEGDGVDLGLNTYTQPCTHTHTHTHTLTHTHTHRGFQVYSIHIQHLIQFFTPHHPPSQITIWLIHTVSTISASWRHLKFVHTIALTLGQI